MGSDDYDEIQRLAAWLHENYEDIAYRVGWETQEGTSVPFDDLPAENRHVMITLATRLVGKFDMRLPREEFDTPRRLPPRQPTVEVGRDADLRFWKAQVDAATQHVDCPYCSGNLQVVSDEMEAFIDSASR